MICVISSNKYQPNLIHLLNYSETVKDIKLGWGNTSTLDELVKYQMSLKMGVQFKMAPELIALCSSYIEPNLFTTASVADKSLAITKIVHRASSGMTTGKSNKYYRVHISRLLFLSIALLNKRHLRILKPVAKTWRCKSGKLESGWGPNRCDQYRLNW